MQGEMWTAGARLSGKFQCSSGIEGAWVGGRVGEGGLLKRLKVGKKCVCLFSIRCSGSFGDLRDFGSLFPVSGDGRRFGQEKQANMQLIGAGGGLGVLSHDLIMHGGRALRAQDWGMGLGGALS